MTDDDETVIDLRGNPDALAYLDMLDAVLCGAFVPKCWSQSGDLACPACGSDSLALVYERRRWFKGS